MEGLTLEEKRLIGRYCIVRSGKAGVFAGWLKERDGDEAVLSAARRIWSWAGAASLSQLAMEGVKKPLECRFSMAVDEICILDVAEIIPCTETAIQNISEVPVWKA